MLKWGTEQNSVGSVLRTEWLICVKEPSKHPADQELRKQESVREKGRENRSASMISKAQLYHGGVKTIWLTDGGPLTPKMIQLILLAVCALPLLLSFKPPVQSCLFSQGCWRRMTFPHEDHSQQILRWIMLYIWMIGKGKAGDCTFNTAFPKKKDWWKMLFNPHWEASSKLSGVLNSLLWACPKSPT